MIVLGAGMAGLLAAAMLRNKCSKVIEAQKELPKNHSAVLRFKSSIVGDTLNIPFAKVKALKYSLPWHNPMADMLAYSYKTNQSFQTRSIVTAKGEEVDRWIAPIDFVEQLQKACSAPIEFGNKIGEGALNGVDGKKPEVPAISTLPMPALMKLLGYPDQPKFDYIGGLSLVAKLAKSSCYASIYVPNPNFGPYRISINGDKIISEVSIPKQPDDLASCISKWKIETLDILGLYESLVTEWDIKPQKFMKIIPIEERTRKHFIMWASEKFNVYSLGRFSTWRPGLELDGLVNDVRIIQSIIKSTNYDYKK